MMPDLDGFQPIAPSNRRAEILAEAASAQDERIRLHFSLKAGLAI
jgi:hypothetical protein